MPSILPAILNAAPSYQFPPIQHQHHRHRPSRPDWLDHQHSDYLSASSQLASLAPSSSLPALFFLTPSPILPAFPSPDSPIPFNCLLAKLGAFCCVCSDFSDQSCSSPPPLPCTPLPPSPLLRLVWSGPSSHRCNLVTNLSPSGGALFSRSSSLRLLVGLTAVVNLLKSRGISHLLCAHLPSASLPQTCLPSSIPGPNPKHQTQPTSSVGVPALGNAQQG